MSPIVAIALAVFAIGVLVGWFCSFLPPPYAIIALAVFAIGVLVGGIIVTLTVAGSLVVNRRDGGGSCDPRY